MMIQSFQSARAHLKLNCFLILTLRSAFHSTDLRFDAYQKFSPHAPRRTFMRNSAPTQKYQKFMMGNFRKLLFKRMPQVHT